MVLVVVFGWRLRAGNPVEVNKSKRGLGQIAHNDVAAWISLLPCLDGRNCRVGAKSSNFRGD